MPWWLEHAAMAAAFTAFAAVLAWRGHWSWLGAAALSQAPFWGGFLAFLATGEVAPAQANAIFNLIVAAAFAQFAEWLQVNGRKGIVQIWLCVLFLLMATIDGIYLVISFWWYVIVQEALHYIALLVIGGRAYVWRIDRRNNQRSNISDTETGGDLA